MVTPEFSHIVKISEIGAGRPVRLTADAEERAGLCKRFDLAALNSLETDLTLTHDGESIMAKGRFTASLAQICVATGEPVPVKLDEPLHIRFIPEPVVQADGEIELDTDDCDTIFHDGQSIDLGEAVAQSLGLARDPYPRSADADRILKAAGVKSEEEAGPFGALAGLKEKLANK